MNKSFKMNVHFDENCESIEPLIEFFLINELEKKDNLCNFI